VATESNPETLSINPSSFIAQSAILVFTLVGFQPRIRHIEVRQFARHQ